MVTGSSLSSLLLSQHLLLQTFRPTPNNNSTAVTSLTVSLVNCRQHISPTNPTGPNCLHWLVRNTTFYQLCFSPMEINEAAPNRGRVGRIWKICREYLQDIGKSKKLSAVLVACSILLLHTIIYLGVVPGNRVLQACEDIFFWSLFFGILNLLALIIYVCWYEAVQK